MPQAERAAVFETRTYGGHEMRLLLSTCELRAAELVAAAGTAGVWR